MAVDKIVAIYGNHQNLKDVVEALGQHDIQDVSVLIRHQPDESTRDDIPVDSPEVRTYSTATYPETRQNTQASGKLDYRRPELHDPGAYATQTGSRSLDERFLMSGAATPGAETLVPALENTGSQIGQTSDFISEQIPGQVPGQEPRQQASSLDTSVVDSHRIDERLKQHGDVSIKDPNALKEDAVKGGLLGLLAGAAALLIPGVGPVVAAGPIAAAIAALAGGAALGTAAGSLLGLLQDEGIPDNRVEDYRRAFEAGKGIVIVRLPADQTRTDRANIVQDILHQHFPESVEVLLP